VIFAGIGFGFHKAAKEQKRLEQGIAIKRMLYLLQGEIRYGFTPLPEAVLKISIKTEKEYQPFLKKVAKQLETHSEESFAKIWQQTAEQKLKQVIYEPKFYEILKNMGETIGYLDQQMQEKTILLTIEQLDDLPYERSSSKELQDVPKPRYITKRSDRDHLTIKQLPDIFMTRRGYECQYHFSDRSRWNSCNDPCAGLKTFRKRRAGIFDHTCWTDPCPWLGDPVYL